MVPGQTPQNGPFWGLSATPGLPLHSIPGSPDFPTPVVFPGIPTNFCLTSPRIHHNLNPGEPLTIGRISHGSTQPPPPEPRSLFVLGPRRLPCAPAGPPHASSPHRRLRHGHPPVDRAPQGISRL